MRTRGKGEPERWQTRVSSHVALFLIRLVYQYTAVPTSLAHYGFAFY